MAQIAAILGLPLQEWQDLVAMVGGEVDEVSGLPAFRKIVVTVPRQSGKTTMFLAFMLARASDAWVSLFGPQRIVYTAQTGNDARKKLVEDWLPLLMPHKRALGIDRFLTGMGNEAIVFKNGSRIVLLASSADAGHGKTVDLACVDELFADTDDRREQALIPSMATRPMAQTLVCSTAGTDESVALNRAIARGRAAVEAGKTSGVAFFEWSADPDEDPDDPETWFRCMPALGNTQTLGVIEDARATMSDGEFRRAFLNQPTTADERVIPTQAWDAVCDVNAKPIGQVVFAVDVNPERSMASIAAASGGLVPIVELVAHRPGVGWLADAVVKAARKANASVVVDGAGPAGFIVAELEAAGVTVGVLVGRQVIGACGAFYDRVLEGRVRLRASKSLDDAAAGASKRQAGDAWAWARKHTSVDVSPLVAATLATWGAAGGAVPVASGLIDPNDYDEE